MARIGSDSVRPQRCFGGDQDGPRSFRNRAGLPGQSGDRLVTARNENEHLNSGARAGFRTVCGRWAELNHRGQIMTSSRNSGEFLRPGDRGGIGTKRRAHVPKRLAITDLAKAPAKPWHADCNSLLVNGAVANDACSAPRGVCSRFKDLPEAGATSWSTNRF